MLGVFVVHFRPWQGGLLEDWGLALAWQGEGMQGLVARLPATLGRPFHLVPHYLGMLSSDGGFVGPYAVLGLVAVAQLLAAAWAMRPLTSSVVQRATAGLAIALHPWWAAGDVLRFLPAQVATLATVVWLGAALRLLVWGGAKWGVLLVVAPAAGLLTYQAPAAALALGSVAVALVVPASWRRRAWVVGLTGAAVVAVLAWSVVVVPRIYHDSYEAQLRPATLDLVASVRAILRTLAIEAPAAAMALMLVTVLVVGLGFHQRLGARPAWVLLGAVLVAPLAALVYASQASHLNDPDRVALPVGLLVWIVLACALPAVGGGRLRTVVTAAVVVGALVGAVGAYDTWTGYSAAQQDLLEAVQHVREQTPADGELVVADHSGEFGDIYTLLPPHLNLALDATYGPGADAILCTPDGVVRKHPTAAVFPLQTTPDCPQLLADRVLGPPEAVTVEAGLIEIYEVASE